MVQSRQTLCTTAPIMHNLNEFDSVESLSRRLRHLNSVPNFAEYDIWARETPVSTKATCDKLHINGYRTSESPVLTKSTYVQLHRNGYGSKLTRSCGSRMPRNGLSLTRNRCGSSVQDHDAIDAASYRDMKPAVLRFKHTIRTGKSWIFFLQIICYSPTHDIS